MERPLAHRLLTLAVLGLTALGLGGCNTKLKQENANLWKENQELHTALTEAREALDSANADRDRILRELADAKANTGTPIPGPVANPAGDINWAGLGEGVSVHEDQGKVTVRVSGDILFDSGRNSLKSNAKTTLARIAEILKSKYPGQRVRIEGHTDSDPIVKSKNLWRDNYHLSEGRAISVRDYLAERGIARNRMMIVAHGPDSPIASNSSRSGKSQNRRVEIIVVAN